MRLKDSFLKICKQNNNLVGNIIVSGGVKGLAVLINVLTTPAYMKFFSNDAVLGVWLTLISILTTVAVLDFGLGNGLRNKLTAAIAYNNNNESKQLISSAYCIVILIAIIVLFAGLIIIPFLPWNSILGIDDSSIENKALMQCIIVVFSTVVIQIVLKMITSVLYAQQKSALVSILSVITNALMLIYVLLVPEKDSCENLRNLSFFYFFACNIPYLVVTIILFWGRYSYLRPSRLYNNWKLGKSILNLGIKFFYISIISMMVHNTNEVLISALFSSSMVVEYQIYNKIFYLITTFINVLMIPLWSAITKALSQREYKWIKKLHALLCASSGVALVCGFLVIPVMQTIVDIWLGDNGIVINKTFCVPFAVYVAIDAWNGANATVANGTGWIKVQMMMMPITAVFDILLTLLLRNIFNSWIVIQIANILSLLPIAGIQFAYLKWKINVVMLREYETGVNVA